MTRLPFTATVVAAAFALAACGSDSVASSPPTLGPAQTSAAAGAQTDTVSIAAAGSMGNILVDSSGKALYTPDEEADGTVHCVGDCLSIWSPLTLKSGAPMGPAGGPALAVIDRPDGPKQVTAGGRPLYTFSLDTPGNVTGDGATDTFGSEHFTWHVVHADGTVGGTPAASTPSTPSGGGYGGY